MIPGLALLRGDRIAYSVLRELSKAYLVGVPVSPRTVSRVYGVRAESVYRFIGELVEVGVISRVGRGYVLRDKCVADFFTYLLRVEASRLRLSGAEKILYTRVPDTMYYASIVYPKVLTGKPPTLLVVSRDVWRRLSLGEKRLLRDSFDAVVECSLRGRRYRFNWENGSTVASDPQAYADILSYHPYPEAVLYTMVYDLETGLNHPPPREVLDACSNARCTRLIGAIAYAMKLGDIPQVNPHELSEEEKTILYEGLKALTSIEKLAKWDEIL